MLYFRNPDDLLIPNMMIDTSPWPSYSRQSPWLPCSGHMISSTGPSVSPFRDFFLLKLTKVSKFQNKSYFMVWLNTLFTPKHVNFNQNLKIFFSSKISRDIKIVYHIDKVVPNFLQEKKAKEKKGSQHQGDNSSREQNMS